MRKVDRPVLSDKRYAEIIEDSTVDCYDEYEEVAGFASMLHENVSVPFGAKIANAPVKIIDFESEGTRVVAKIETGGKISCVDLRDIEPDQSDQQSLEWILAYQRWRKGW